MRVGLHTALALLLCAMPASAYGALLINEVAWMGTETSANDEWIELYNSSETAVNVDGWTLIDNDELRIELSGTVDGNEHVVLERTDDSSAPGDAFVVYTGALTNGGKTLTLLRSDGSIEDQVAGGSDWESIGGDNETKETAQRTNEGWVTEAATPGAANAADSEPEQDTTQSTSTATTSSQIDTESEDDDGRKGENVRISLTEPDNELTLTVDAPEVGYVKQPMTFSVAPDGIGETLMESLSYTWSFGDATTGAGDSATHTYEHPGTYIVVVEATFSKYTARTRHEVTVLPVAFSLGRNDDGDVQIHNDAQYEVDLSNFQLRGARELLIPEHTILTAKGTITVPRDEIETTGRSMIVLYDAAGAAVASLAPKHLTATLQAERGPAPEQPRQRPAPAPEREETASVSVATNTPSREAADTSLPPAPLRPTNTAAAIDAADESGYGNLTYYAFAGLVIIGVLAVYANRFV